MSRRWLAVAPGILGAAAVLALGAAESTSPVKHVQWPLKLSSRSRVYAIDSLLGEGSLRHQIDIEVTTSVKRGPAKGYFTYTYTVRSDRTSRSGVESFAIAPVPRPDSIVSPYQWAADFGYETREDALAWVVIDTLTQPPVGWESTNTWPSPYGIQPGETKIFRLVSKYPPMKTEYFSQGFGGIPDADAYDDEHFPTLFNMGVKGDAYGPDDSLALEDRVQQWRKMR